MLTAAAQTSQPVKRKMHNPAAFVGQRINLTKWQLPRNAEYAICRMTGKLMHMDDLGVTFWHQAFERSFLSKHGIMIEDADWLSEEGYEAIMNKLVSLGELDTYLRHCYRGLWQ
jgi:hypothetical protein